MKKITGVVTNYRIILCKTEQLIYSLQFLISKNS